MKLPIYLDNHATTPLDPRVLEAMLPFLKEDFGNAASRQHAFGRKADAAVEKARKQVAGLIHAAPEEIIFTSGATESDNLAIKGVARMYREKGDHLITCVTEHSAVLDTCQSLEKEGFRVTYLPVDTTGLVDLAALEKAITPKTILISIMAANNEVGTIAPIAEIGKLAHAKGVLFHTDAAQAAGRIPLDVEAMHIDLLSLSAHKMYGPKGIGALYVRKKNPRVRIAPLMDGGGHEQGLRSGTLNVAGIAGLGEACAIAAKELVSEAKRMAALRDRLQEKICKSLDKIEVNGHPAQRLPGNLNVSFAFLEAEAFLDAVANDMAVSSGSACSSANAEPSHVVKALGKGDQVVHNSIRFGLGRFTTEEEIDHAAKVTVATVRTLREASPLYAMSKQEEAKQ